MPESAGGMYASGSQPAGVGRVARIVLPGSCRTEAPFNQGDAPQLGTKESLVGPRKGEMIQDILVCQGKVERREQKICFPVL